MSSGVCRGPADGHGRVGVGHVERRLCKDVRFQMSEERKGVCMLDVCGHDVFRVCVYFQRLSQSAGEADK